jgi:hypothetical protein
MNEAAPCCNVLRGAQILVELNLVGVVLNRSRERNETACY